MASSQSSATVGGITQEPLRDDASFYMEAFATGGKPADFAQLCKLLMPTLYRLAVALKCDAALADDMVQVTLLCIHRSRQLFVPGEPVLPWARTIFANRLRSHRRRVSREVSGVEELLLSRVSTLPTPEEAARIGEVEGCIRVAAAMGPTDEGFEICQVALGLLTPREAADRLELTVDAVKQRAKRLKPKLARIVLKLDAGRR